MDTDRMCHPMGGASVVLKLHYCKQSAVDIRHVSAPVSVYARVSLARAVTTKEKCEAGRNVPFSIE